MRTQRNDRTMPDAGTPLRKVALLILSSATLACCANQTDAERDYDRALARWRRAGLVNYSYRSAVSCFCPVEFTRPMTVTVRNGVVVIIVDRATGASQPLTYRAPIDSLFSTAAREIRERPERLRVSYDNVLGYPRSLTYGTPENDAGGNIVADSLVAIP